MKKIFASFAVAAVAVMLGSEVRAQSVITQQYQNSTNTNSQPLEMSLEVSIVSTIQGTLYSAGATGSFDFPDRLIHSLTATSMGNVISGSPTDIHVYKNVAGAHLGTLYGYDYSTGVKSSGMLSTTIEQVAVVLPGSDAGFTRDAGQSDIWVSAPPLLTSTETVQATVPSNAIVCGAGLQGTVDSSFCGLLPTVSADMDRTLYATVTDDIPNGEFLVGGVQITWREGL